MSRRKGRVVATRSPAESISSPAARPAIVPPRRRPWVLAATIVALLAWIAALALLAWREA